MSHEAPPPRVLILEANLDGTVGGSHQVLWDLVTRLTPGAFEPVVAFYQDNPYVERLAAVNVETHVLDDMVEGERHLRLSGGRVRKAMDILVGAVLRRAFWLRRNRIDLVYINNSPYVGYDDWLPASRFVRRPCLASAMGDAHVSPTRYQGVWLKRFDHVMPVSQHIQRGMTRAGIPPQRQTVVYPGVDLDEFTGRVRRSPEEVRAELGVPAHCLLGVMVGNIRRWKGQSVVLQGLAGLDPDSRSRIRVVFAGASRPKDQEYVAELEAYTKEAGLEEIVRFLGPRKDVPELFAAADFAIHGSTLAEPFGLVVVEALAVGTPVLAGSGGGPAEIMDEDCGILWDTGEPSQLTEAIEGLLASPERLAAMSAHAPDRARRFSVEAYVRGMERVWQSALDGGTNQNP